jgi:hypothetical protein
MKQACNILGILLCNRNFRKPKPDDIFGGVFDTTSSNTGKEEGAVVPLERLWTRNFFGYHAGII